MRKALIAGNWKMFKTLEEAVLFAEELALRVKDVSDREILVCPSDIFIYPLIQALADSSVFVGAQNVFWEDQGAFTGEVSAPMVKSTGARFAIIGHSERRQYFSETDETVNKRLNACLKAGITPIVCVGETLAENEAGQTAAVVSRQVRLGLQDLTQEQALKVIIAYEPVWAIGTGKVCDADEADRVCGVIRGIVKEMYGADAAEAVRIQYGGSVKPENAHSLLSQPDVDGALVGGASLEARSFADIIRNSI